MHEIITKDGKKEIHVGNERFVELLSEKVIQKRIKEIGKQLGLSEQKVSNLKSYALTLLKKQMA